MPSYTGFRKGSGGNESTGKSLGVLVESSPLCSPASVSSLCNGLVYHPSQEETVRLQAKGLRALRRRPGKKETKKEERKKEGRRQSREPG